MIDATCNYFFPSMPSSENQISLIRNIMCLQHLWAEKKNTKLPTEDSSLLLIVCCQCIYLWISASCNYCVERYLRVFFSFSEHHLKINFAKRVDQTYHRSKKQSIECFAWFLPITAKKFDRSTSFKFNDGTPFPAYPVFKSTSWNSYLRKSLVYIWCL